MKTSVVEVKSRRFFYLKLIIILILIVFFSTLLIPKLLVFGPITDIFELLFITVVSIFIAILVAVFIVLTIEEYKDYFKFKSVPIKKLHYLSFEDVFENENRKKIIKKILEEPGVHNNELLRQCNLQKGQLQWHLYVLLQYGIIRKEKIGQYTAFFPMKINLESYKNSNKFLIKAKMTLRVLDIIEDNPGINASSIARQLNFNRSSVKYHIDKLAKKNLIILKKKGREIELVTNQASI